MKAKNIPSVEECYEIMKKRMLPHIKEHSEQVMKVAVSITDHLKPNVIINKSLVIAASLLHDITKTESLTTREPHDITGGIFLRELGYYDVADIVEEHVHLKNYDINENLKEKEIVFYADKRVMHTKIVSVEDRISDLVIRYGKSELIKKHIIENKNSILNIEKKINNNMLKDLNDVILCLK
ncbi:MAG: HD domain-containing protein [Spirochaetota bacterium]